MKTIDVYEYLMCLKQVIPKLQVYSACSIQQQAPEAGDRRLQMICAEKHFKRSEIYLL